MSQVCELTGTRPEVGILKSHANNKNRTRWIPNLKYKRYEIGELGRTLTLRVSAGGIRTIQKLGSIEKAILPSAVIRCATSLVDAKIASLAAMAVEPVCILAPGVSSACLIATTPCLR